MAAASFVSNFSITDSEASYTPRSTPKKILKVKNVRGNHSSIKNSKPKQRKERKRKIETTIKAPTSVEFLPTASESEGEEENQPPSPSKKSKVKIINTENVKYSIQIHPDFEDLLLKDQQPLNRPLYFQQEEPEQPNYKPSSVVQNVPPQLVDPYLLNQRNDSIDDILPRTPRTPNPTHFFPIDKPIIPIASKNLRMENRVVESESESDEEPSVRTKKIKPRVKKIVENDSCISDLESDESCVSDIENENETNNQHSKKEPKILECLAKENENEEMLNTSNKNNTKMGPPPPLKLTIKHIDSFVSKTGNESTRSQSDGEESDELDEVDEGMYLLFFYLYFFVINMNCRPCCKVEIKLIIFHLFN